MLRGESTNTAASDVYSFGIVLFEVYSRKEPYEGEAFAEVLALVCDPKINKRPNPPPACPEEIKSIMSECLRGNPADRPSFQDLDIRIRALDAVNVEPGESLYTHRMRKERKREELLQDVFPKHIAQALSEGRKVEPESKDCVAIYFSDIVGFTTLSSTMSAIKVSDMLDRLYSKFDALSEQHEVYKLETIGDAYMGVTNLILSQESDFVKRIAFFAVDTVEAANTTLVDEDDPSKGFVDIRVGFHAGPVVANVVGTRNPKYTLFGDAVNTSSRMESTSRKNRIQCSKAAARLLAQQAPELRLKSRGRIKVKGKGEMSTFWVNEKRWARTIAEEAFDDSAVVGLSMHDSFQLGSSDPLGSSSSGLSTELSESAIDLGKREQFKRVSFKSAPKVLEAVDEEQGIVHSRTEDQRELSTVPGVSSEDSSVLF